MEKKSLLDRTPLKSKKFIVAAFASICWVILLVLGFYKNASSEVLIAMIYVAGTVQSLYLGGQSAVDAFVRAAVARTEAKKDQQ